MARSNSTFHVLADIAGHLAKCVVCACFWLEEPEDWSPALSAKLCVFWQRQVHFGNVSLCIKGL